TNTALANKTIVLGGTRTIGTLNVTGAGGVNASGTLSIGNAGQLLAFNNSASDAVINLGGGITLRVLANVSASGNLQVNNNSGVVGSIVLGGTTTITGTAKFSNADPYAGITVSGRLAAAGVVKDGSGSLILSGSGNAITGNIAFNNGSIVIGNNNVLGSGAINLNGSGARRLNLQNATDRSLTNALNLSTTDLIVGREDAATASALRTLTINPAAASVSALGSGTRTLTVESLTGLAFGNNQAFSGGTLLKDGGGVLTLGGAASTFTKLQVELGTVRGFLNGNTTLGGGPSVFGAGNISVTGGNTVLEITGTNNADTLTIGNNANISLNDYATFKLSGGGLALVGGTINLNGNGILDYGAGTVTLGNTAILGASADGFNFGSNLIFTANTGITSTGTYRYNLTNSGTQILSRDSAGAVSISGTMIKTGTGLTLVDSSVTMLTLTRPLQLDAGTFDLGANAVFIGTVAIGGGDLAFGRAAQMGGGRLAFDSASTGAARLRGFDETFAGVSVGAGAIARLDLGGDIIRATTLNLGTVSFANTTGILSVAGYLPGANSDHVNLTNTLTSTQLANQVWFYGYNPGATQSGSELFTPVAGGIPDFLRVEWTSGANTMDAADYRNWRVVGSNLVNPLAVPNAPGVTVVIGNAAGEIGARTLTGANFGVTGSTWTVGNIIFDSTISSGNAQMAVDSGAGVTLVYDSGRAGVPAVIQNNRMYYPYIRGTGLLQSDLLLTGNNAMMFSQVLTGTHNVIIDKPVGTSTEIRWYGNSPNFLGDMVLQSGALYTLAGNYGLGRIIFSGTSTTNSPLLAGTTGGSSGKMHISNQLVINSNFSLSHVWIDYGGDIELTANRALTVNVETSTPGQRASVTFSGSTNLTGSGRLTKSGASAELLSGNNSFSGGLAVSSGILYTTVGANGLTIGRLDAGKNYLGTGSISVAGGGSLRVDTQGYATTVSGVTGSDAIINLSSAFMSFDNGGLVTLGTNSRVIGNNTDAAQLRVSGSLVLDGVQFGNGGADSARNVVLNLDTTTNPDGLRVTKGVNGSATVGGLRQIVKTGAGQATLDSALTFTIGGSVILNGGVLRLTGNNQITHYDTSLTDILLNGGGLGVEGTTQNFDTLHLFGNGGSLLLGADGKLTFANAGSGASWLTTGLLSIQNTSGVWNANGSGAFVRFANNPNLSTLDNISFTGYEAGVQVTSTNGYYYLLPSADALATVEWSGGGANTQWSLGTNWLTGSAPNAVDASVSVKDIDQNLATKTIDVNSAYTLSRLNVTSVQTAVTLGGSGTLIFNRSGTGAASRILHDGGSILTVGSAVDLRTNVELSANVPTGAGYVKWTGAVGGSGGFTKTGAGTLLLLNKDNTYSGGFDWLDSSRIQLGGASAASFGGAWFGTGTLTIGDGDASENFYLETYNAQLAAGSVTTANTSRTVSNNFVLRGNLIHQFQSDLGVTLSNSADFQSYIYFNGNGVIGTLDDEGKEFIVSNVGGSTARTTPGTVIIFAGNLTGYANLVQDGNGTVYYRGDNSGFLGNFIFQHGQAYVGKNQALGSGTAIFRSNSTYDAVLRSENATAANPIVLSNPFVWDGNAFGLFGYFNLNLNSAATGQYSVVNAPVVHMKGSGVATFGKDHVITGSGRLTFGQEGSYGNSGTTRFLGANTFSGGVTIGSGAVVQAGRDSVVVDGTLVSGAFGTGTLLFVSQNVGIGAYVGADSVNPNATSIRVSNPISLNYNKFGVVNNSGGGALPMLILDTGSIALRQGKGDLTIDIATGTTNVLRIESLLYDRDVSTPGGITKTGAGVLELANLNNEISAGVEAQAGVVRARVSGASVSVGSHAPGASVFGTGEWLTKTASGAGNAGAFEIAADTAGATVTLTGSNAFVLNDNGQLRVTGSNITTVLASGGYLVSTDTAGQEGSIVADLVKTTNYTLGVKMAAKNWQLDAGTVNLARANLTNSAGTITFQAGSVLNVNHNVQTLSNLVVEGNATIDVSGGLPSNPVIVTIGTVTVNTGLLTFSGWQGDIPTGKGSTIVQSTLNVGTVVRGVSLDSGIEQAIVRRNIDGVSVLIPYDLIFTWDGQAGNNLWEVKDWSKNGTHSDIEQPDGVTATAIFDTTAANLSGQTVNLSDNRRVGTLNFTGA
ncbi:MAG: autotransporter-associated beta strand repeat-containing protein, partial [Verrucomicrobiales bacterium]|nr:autotransporter-associated beta strand repeat-containing protein [Verrucomicrobiales bacterium]